MYWISPLKVSEGFAQDISKFHFRICEPIWYFNQVKVPENAWKPGKWMAFVYSTGENMYYYIIKDVNKPWYLIYSVICACRKNIGTVKECFDGGANHAT